MLFTKDQIKETRQNASVLFAETHVRPRLTDMLIAECGRTEADRMIEEALKLGVHFSMDVSKLGNDELRIPTIGNMRECACNPDAPCFNLCYAGHGRFVFSNVQDGLFRNQLIYENRPDDYWESILKKILYNPFFRFHHTGEIIDEQYVENAMKVANENPSCHSLCFTKKFYLINNLIDKYGVNRVLTGFRPVCSNWGTWKQDNPHNLPESYINFKNKTPEQSHIPAHAIKCPGNCANCIMAGNPHSCFTMSFGEARYFDQH